VQYILNKYLGCSGTSTKNIFLSEVDIKTHKSRDNVQENFVAMLIDGTQWYSTCTRWYPAKVHRGFFGFWEILRFIKEALRGVLSGAHCFL
jgi:hypothetical protein